MPKTNYQKIFLHTLFLVFTFCLTNSITVSASVMDATVDGMSGFSIIGDDKIFLDIDNVNIFGKTYTEMETWAGVNGWRLATDVEFLELINAIIPGYLYSSPTYDDGHFTSAESLIIGANLPDGLPNEEEYFTAFFNDTRAGYAGWHNEIGVGTFNEDDGDGNFYHSWYGIELQKNLTDITYYGYESALLIKEDQVPIPEPTTMLLFGIGLLGLAGVSRRKK